MNLNLSGWVDKPAIIDRIDFVEQQGRLFLRASTKSGHFGLVEGNEPLRYSASLFNNLIRPFFIGKDARDLEALVDDVYLAGRNYKFAGMPFWNGVAHIELSLFDLLGKLANVPVHRLIGNKIREQIPVYLTGFGRDYDVQTGVEAMCQQIEQTGTKAYKLKIGGRIGRSETYPDRTRDLVQAARIRLGSDIELLVDANGSYSAEEAIELGEFLQEHGVTLFEEPCPWEERSQTQQVTETLDLTVSGGEQDSSLPTIQTMIEQRVVDLIQPDVYYLGGIIRTLRVARMAAEAGMEIVLHGPGGGERNLPNLHLAAVIPNLWKYQEYPATEAVVGGSVEIPQEPGLSFLFKGN